MSKEHNELTKILNSEINYLNFNRNLTMEDAEEHQLNTSQHLLITLGWEIGYGFSVKYPVVEPCVREQCVNWFNRWSDEPIKGQTITIYGLF